MIPHSLNFPPKSDLIINIKEYSKENNIYGFVSGIVGNLNSACIQCPNTQSVNIYEGNLEIISLNGFFDKGDVHLHLCISDESCNVFGGHLEEGSVIQKGVDIFLLSFDKKILKSNYIDTYSKKARVKIYLLKNCPWSKRAIRLLESSNIKFDSMYINNDEDFKRVNSLSKHDTFPQVFLDDIFFGGYDELSIQYKENLLESFK